MITDSLLKGYVENSTTYMNWSITLVGASFVLILGDSYYKPSGKSKLLYLGFFPAWIFIARSLYYATDISNTYLGTKFLNPKSNNYQSLLDDYGYTINNSYNSQTTSFYWGLTIMGLCLAILVLFQIFDNSKVKPKK